MKKRLLALGLAVLACISLTACSDEGKKISELKLNKYVELGQYSGLEFTPGVEPVTDEVVLAETEATFKQYGSKVGETTGTAETGDICNIDFAGYIDDVAFEGGTATSQEAIIGSGRYIPGFEEGIVGMTPGETKDVVVTFPENYQAEDLAGKEAVFKITLNYIVPELSDAAVARIGSADYSTVEEMKAFVRNELEEEYQANLVKDIGAQAIYKAIENSTFREIPEHLIEEQKQMIFNNYANVQQNYGATVDEYVSVVYGVTVAELAERYVKQRMVIQMIANNEGIVVDEAEIDAKLQPLADEAGMSIDELVTSAGITKDTFLEQLLTEKVCQYLYENSTITK